eukprot:gene57186-biopygen88313
MRARAQRPFIPQEAAEELAEQGITLPGVATSSTEEDGKEEAQAVLEAWERAWERIKKELAPRVRTTVRKGDKQFPWVTDAVREARRKRNELQRKAHTVEEKVEYRKARREAERMYKKARKTYIAEHWKKAGDTPFSKEHWRFLNSIMGRKSKRKTEPKCGPDKVNDAFIKKVERIREPLLQNPKPDIKVSPDIPTLREFRRVTRDEVVEELGRVKPTRSAGIDEVPMAMLTRHKEVLGEHIARVVNAVIETEWPKGWKSAEVMPLWKKKGSTNDPTKYRPVALLPAISRVVERVLAKQLKEHVRRAKLMPLFQHGFVPGRSCETAVMQLVDLVATARDRGETVYVASADCSAAFDTIDHEIMLERLERQAGIGGTALKLIASYLEGRRQRVRMSGGRTSAWQKLKSGVPQGSVWGPLAFALYSADIGKYITEARLVTYADDITLVCSHKDPQRAREMMDRALAQLDEWAKRNRIAPEPTKTQLMVSGPHALMKRLREMACEMGEHQVPPSQMIKVLGVLIDEQMSWEAHSAAAVKRANRAVWAVSRVARHFTVKERAHLMRSLALPHLDFCQNALAGPSAAAAERMRRGYNKTARAAVWGLQALYRWKKDGEPKERLRSAPARQQLRWITWDQRRAAARAAVTAKVFHTEEPEALRGLLGHITAAKIHRRRLRRHTKGCVVTIAAKTKIGEKAFSVWGPRVLNAIATDAVFDQCPDGAPEIAEPRGGPPRMGRAPADEQAVERAGYYARLRDEFKGQEEWRDEEGRVRVWTDGSRCLRGGRLSAGAGVFYGTGHTANRALSVPGRQCNARAELYAVLHVLRTEPRPVVVRSDCKYVVDGVKLGRKTWRAKAWFRRPLEGRLIANADLWKEIDQVLELREAAFEVKWTKGHPLPRHVREQVTTEIDSYGNVGADFLAGVASAQVTPAQRRAAQLSAQRPRALTAGQL